MAKTEGDLVRLSLDEVRTLATESLVHHGASIEQAQAVAETITSAERDGCKSHGLFRLPGYIGSLKSGKITGDAVPVVSELAPAVVKVDAANGFSSLPLDMGTAALAEKAREMGIAALAITNSYHFAALWPGAQPALHQLSHRAAFPCRRRCGGLWRLAGYAGSRQADLALSSCALL